jgi:hypothetical protein
MQFWHRKSGCPVVSERVCLRGPRYSVGGAQVAHRICLANGQCRIVNASVGLGPRDPRRAAVSRGPEVNVTPGTSALLLTGDQFGTGSKPSSPIGQALSVLTSGATPKRITQEPIDVSWTDVETDGGLEGAHATGVRPPVGLSTYLNPLRQYARVQAGNGADPRGAHLDIRV